jgi:hypothetical protein
MDWLSSDPDDLLDEVVEAKILSGEDIDASSERVRKRVLDEIALAQRNIRAETTVAADGRILLHRALVLDDAAIASLSPGQGLGESWAFSELGAHPYDSVRRGRTVIVSGLVHPDDVFGPFVLAMWSSGEGEARLRRQAEIEIIRLVAKGTVELREDLKGTVFGVTDLPVTPRPR